MSRTYHHDRRMRVRGVRRDPVDTRKLARALIAFAQAEAEASAQLVHEQQKRAERGAPTARRRHPADGDAA